MLIGELICEAYEYWSKERYNENFVAYEMLHATDEKNFWPEYGQKMAFELSMNWQWRN